MKQVMIAFVALGIPFYASASVVISEVMYDLEGTDTKREWIEITNVSDTSVDPGDIVFFEANTSHKLKIISGGMELLPGASAVIALDATQFMDDQSTYTSLLVDSSWSSLSNDGESFELRNQEGVVLDRVAYTKDMGGSGKWNGP